jgi:hypothetical protein
MFDNNHLKQKRDAGLDVPLLIIVTKTVLPEDLICSLIIPRQASAPQKGSQEPAYVDKMQKRYRERGDFSANRARRPTGAPRHS